MKRIKSIFVLAIGLLTLWINSPVRHLHKDHHNHSTLSFNNGLSEASCYICDQIHSDLETPHQAILINRVGCEANVSSVLLSNLPKSVHFNRLGRAPPMA